LRAQIAEITPTLQEKIVSALTMCSSVIDTSSMTNDWEIGSFLHSIQGNVIASAFNTLTGVLTGAAAIAIMGDGDRERFPDFGRIEELPRNLPGADYALNAIDGGKKSKKYKNKKYKKLITKKYKKYKKYYNRTNKKLDKRRMSIRSRT
jgi:hypothetical protein